MKTNFATTKESRLINGAQSHIQTAHFKTFLNQKKVSPEARQRVLPIDGSDLRLYINTFEIEGQASISHAMTLIEHYF
jgi:hypothetical protein